MPKDALMDLISTVMEDPSSTAVAVDLARAVAEAIRDGRVTFTEEPK